ncbi:hypothetical protein [Kineosporia babensis]|uniref:Uncharacterized protein n=1 Tax=Kineosporia babensis TaxID=499548 RepID=A0A9X1NBL6_9ACTN|nr:hypothetical protein [Kineosporia babensis]MCD5310786.1 hypothetical protein [Kineosporia babensis]
MSDEYGTDTGSLVPANLDPEPDDYQEPDEAGSGDVIAPTAVDFGDPIEDTDETLADDDFDAAGDLAWLMSEGDRD